MSTNDLEAALCGNDYNQLLEARIVPPTVGEHLRKDLSVTVVIFGVTSSLSNRSKRRKSLKPEHEQIYSYIEISRFKNIQIPFNIHTNQTFFIKGTMKVEVSLPCHSAEHSLSTSKSIPIREKSLLYASRLPVPAVAEDIDFNHCNTYSTNTGTSHTCGSPADNMQLTLAAPLFLNITVCMHHAPPIVREHGRGKPGSLLELPVNKSKMR